MLFSNKKHTYIIESKKNFGGIKNNLIVYSEVHKHIYYIVSNKCQLNYFIFLNYIVIRQK